MIIQLTPAEQQELHIRSHVPYGREPTLARFWQNLLASKGVTPRARQIPVTVPTAAPGQFRLEWHSRALGPQAIAQGIAFRAHMEARDRKFTERLAAQGRESPTDHWR